MACISPPFPPPGRVAGSDHGKSAKALGEFARKTSLALDICKTVARKSSRVASRAGSGSISWAMDRHGSRSNSDIAMPPNRPQIKGLMNDTAFDRAVAEHGLRKPVDNGAHAAAAAVSTAFSGQEASSVLKACKAAGPVIPGRPHVTTASLSVNDYRLARPLPVGTASRAAVQFATSDQTVLLPASRAGSTAFSSGEYRQARYKPTTRFVDCCLISPCYPLGKYQCLSHYTAGSTHGLIHFLT